MHELENTQKTTTPNILVTGMCSLRSGAMEFDNLGNFIIIDPFFRSIRSHFSKSVIHTTLQLSEEFLAKNELKQLSDPSFFEYKLSNTLRIFADLVSASLWNVFKNFSFDFETLSHASPRLAAISNSDIVIDFSGDMFGENALNWHHFLIGALNPLLCKILGKKVYFVASSPGPFRSIIRLALAKFSLKLFDIVSVREPLSLNILNGIGLVGEKFCCHPCFSYGFKPVLISNEEKLFSQDPYLRSNDKTTVGLILCNLNMLQLPSNKWPRCDSEYEVFVEYITWIVDEFDVRVCLFSHRNKTDGEGQLKRGSDHDIVNRLIELLPEETAKNVYTLNGRYDANAINKIIGGFEILISGRIHGALQGIIQYIPTVIIDYGMEPKAHKLRGFATLCGLQESICDPNDIADLKKKTANTWVNRDNITENFKSRIPNLIKKSEAIWGKINEACSK